MSDECVLVRQATIDAGLACAYILAGIVAVIVGVKTGRKGLTLAQDYNTEGHGIFLTVISTALVFGGILLVVLDVSDAVTGFINPEAIAIYRLMH